MPESILRHEPAKPGGKDNLFLWTIFLLFLAALVFACWLGSFYVFGHPEQARSYRILKRLGKIAPPVRFVVTKAPPGEFLESQRVFERYSKYTALQMKRENDLLFRSYLKNFSETKKLVPYLSGRFQILRAYELQANDLINGGVVVLTQSVEFPQLLAEVLYPSSKEAVADILSVLQPGVELRLQRTLDLSAIIQVSHAFDGRLQVTVVPLLYGSYALKNGEGNFSLEPPNSLNVAAGFPVVRGEEVRSVMRENLRRHTTAKAGSLSPVEPKGEIVRLEEVPVSGGESGVKSAVETAQLPSAVLAPQQKAPEPEQKEVPADGRTAPLVNSAAKDLPSAKAESVQKAGSEWLAKAEKILAGATSVSTSSKKDGSSVALNGTATQSGTVAGGQKPAKSVSAGTLGSSVVQPSKPGPAVAISGGSVNVAKVVPPKVEPVHKETLARVDPASSSRPIQATEGSKVPLQQSAGTSPAPVNKPFVAAAPPPSVTQPTGAWKTYGSGRLPSGKSVTAEQASALQGRNDGAPMYLHGRFTVTAAGTNRAVLRQASASDGKVQPRVIVEYPAGAVPPKQGASVARDDGRGFEIREVRRTPDGQINIYVREVGGL